MKKIIIVFLLISVSSFKSRGQTYREQFDKLDQLPFSSDAYLNSSNFEGYLHNIHMYLMESYILMYKKTSDIKYLNKFIITSKRVMDRRDDNFYNAKNYMNLPVTIGSCTIGPNTLQIVSSSKGWSRIKSAESCVLEVLFMETGTITHPMAEFTLLIQQHPELDNMPLPAEALSTASGINTYSGVSILTFKQYSDWLGDKVDESLDWQIATTYDTSNDFFENPGGPEGNLSGINQQSAIARTLLLRYLVTGNQTYIGIAQRTGKKVYEVIHDNAIGSLPLIPIGEPYYAWCHIYGCQHNLWEDIFHSWLEIELVMEMVDAGISPWIGVPNFTTNDLREFANGFLYRMCPTPKYVTMNVYGHNLNCNQACDTNNPPPIGTIRPENYFHAGALTFLTQYNSGVYQAVSDIYSPNQTMYSSEPNHPAVSAFKPTDWNGKAMLGLAQLANFANCFNPITVKSSSGSHTYTGLASGDFDGDGQSEFASLNSPIGNNIIEEYTFTLSDNSISTTYNTSIAGTFKYLASGDIITSNIGDELVSIDIQNNLLKVFNKQGNVFTAVAQIGISSGNSAYAGIAIGEFNSSYAGKEIIINSTQGLGTPLLKMYAFDVTSGNLINIPLLNSLTYTSSIDGITVGDFDGNGIDQIAIYVNSFYNHSIRTYSIISGNQLQSNLSYTDNTYYPFDGMTSGNFDGNGPDELILYKQSNASDGVFKIYHVSGGIVEKAHETFPHYNQGNGIMCRARLKNYPVSDALITCRNYDGQLSIFNMDGYCPGLNLNNQTIDNLSSVNNNYTIDYHVNNTIVAGNNFTIADPSIVEMSAGNEIFFLDGVTIEPGAEVHAYIDNALACTNPVFRQSNPHHSEYQSKYISREQQSKVLPVPNLSISPNPSDGSFEIKFSERKIADLKIFDAYGKLLKDFEYNINKEQPFYANIIHLGNVAKGLYILQISSLSGNCYTSKILVK